MPHYEAKLSSKGQITVPSEVREFFRLKEGDRVDFYVDTRSRTVRIMARNAKLADLAGILNKKGRKLPPLTQQDIDAAIGDYLTEKHDRISREWNEWREFQDWKKANALNAAE
jgi:AbrB family looped-hinge helix DNA binding protein